MRRGFAKTWSASANASSAPQAAWDAAPNPEHVYFAVPDLEGSFARVSKRRDAVIRKGIETQPWGERSFYCTDPFGNKLCFVDERTLFTGGLI